MMYLPAFNVPQGGDAVVHSVYRHARVFFRAGNILPHGLEYAACRREETGTALLGIIHIRFQLYVRGLQPAGQLLEGQHGVHQPGVMLCLVLLGDAGTDEYRPCVRMPAPDIGAVRLHGRQDIREAVQLCREVLLNQQIDRVAAGADDDIAVVLCQHPLVLRLDDGRADGGLLHVGKAQLFQRFAHPADPDPVIVCNEGRGETDIDRRAGLDQHPCLFGFVHDLFGILRTDHEALTAQNTLVADDVRLVAGEADGLDGAVPDALITVLAVGFFQGKTFCHGITPPCPAGRLAGRCPARNPGTFLW